MNITFEELKEWEGKSVDDLVKHLKMKNVQEYTKGILGKYYKKSISDKSKNYTSYFYVGESLENMENGLILLEGYIYISYDNKSDNFHCSENLSHKTGLDGLIKEVTNGIIVCISEEEFTKARTRIKEIKENIKELCEGMIS